MFLAASAGLAQDIGPRACFAGVPLYAVSNDAPALDGVIPPPPLPPLDVAVPEARPRMSPELALSTYLNLAYRQLNELGAYSDLTTVDADLPDSAQHGRFELRRSFQAPKTLAFAAVRFVGDGFVKTNIIARLLQSEVDHVQHMQGRRTAITSDNYKFAFKGADVLDDRPVYIFQVKPRHKRPGLFKGHILIDATSGQLRRAEGALVKSPSFFVKKLEFVQDYGEYGQFSLPVHVHSVAKTRLVGRAVVDIFHAHYQAKSVAQIQSENTSTVSGGVSGGSGSN